MIVQLVYLSFRTPIWEPNGCNICLWAPRGFQRGEMFWNGVFPDFHRQRGGESSEVTFGNVYTTVYFISVNPYMIIIITAFSENKLRNLRLLIFLFLCYYSADSSTAW
jgi:hypothetical protein